MLDASSEAVDLLRPAQSVAEKLQLANALTGWANGCFKAACVSDDASWEGWLDRCDAATDEVQQLLHGCPPNSVLGRAILVSGVGMSVRGHKSEAMGRPHRAFFARAIKLCHEAERVLVLARGRVNESSIYTHSNLAELYLHEGFDVRRAFLHFYDGCEVGCALFGPTHPNVHVKLREFADMLDHIGRTRWAERLRQGRVDFRHELEAFLPAFHPPVEVDDWVRADPHA